MYNMDIINMDIIIWIKFW